MEATEAMADTVVMEAMADMGVTSTLPRATRAAMATDWELRPSAPTTGTGQATPLTTSSRALSITAAIISCTSVAMMTMADMVGMAITVMAVMAATDMAVMDMVAMEDTAVAMARAMARAMDTVTMDSKATPTTGTTTATSSPSTPRTRVSS